MTREELIHFMEWWDKRYYPSRLQFHREKDADKYLAEHTLPPAEGATPDHQHDHLLDHPEGAEEITAKKYLSDHGYGSGTNFSSGLVAALMQEFATLHARKMARENNELQELMNNISEWSDKTFGHSQRNPAIIYHLKKEVDELIAAIEKTNALGYDESVGVGEFGRQRMATMAEYADCLMLLLDSAQHFGISAEELIQATHNKLEINKVRKWGKPDKNGVVEHIE